MRLKYSVNIGVWRDGAYASLTNFYTPRVGASSTAPGSIQSLAEGAQVFAEIAKNGSVHAVLPDNAPNALYVVKRLLSVELNRPILAMNLFLQEYSDKGVYVANRQSLYMHDMKLLQFRGTNPANSTANPDGSRTDDNNLTASFQGTIGPIQKIGRSYGV